MSATGIDYQNINLPMLRFERWLIQMYQPMKIHRLLLLQVSSF